MKKWSKEQHAKFRATWQAKRVAVTAVVEKTNGAQSIPEAIIAYTYGYVQHVVESQARSCGVSAAALADRLGRLLLASARR